MKAAGLAASGTLVLILGAAAQSPEALVDHAGRGFTIPPSAYLHAPSPRPAADISEEALTEVVRRVCGLCHNEALLTGNLSLQDYDVADAASVPEISEKMVVKLRAGMMPPPGIPRPAGDTLQVLVETLEKQLDEAARKDPNPGARTFQRLNRSEYANSIRALLGLEVDPGKWLPLDTKSANFDNIADVQMPSATLLDSYLDAASEIARMAVGDANASPSSTSYRIPRLVSQWNRVPGAPMGTRGGTSVMHNFPADGEYVFAVSLHAIPTGQLFGSDAPVDEIIEVSINGERVALIEVDRWMAQSDPNGMEMATEVIPVRAGAHRVTAAFLRTFEGPVNDNLAAIGHSIADTQIGAEQGITNVAHLGELVVKGPYNPTGLSETDSRRRIFTCRPVAPDQELPCAEEILRRLASQAYRRPIEDRDVEPLLGFFEEGTQQGGFEAGIRMALEALLASPHFIFRLEEMPDRARPGERYELEDMDLASRLSFFLWGTPPDGELIELARRGKLHEPKQLREQALRMLADLRAEALATRFAAQWLRLQDLEKIHPDALQFPDFHMQLADAMRRETELLFNSVVREDRSVLDLYRADYTYLNEALARHYGIPGVTGPAFRRVSYPDDRRRGLFGHASVLTLTSHANRTSPVLRGKWVMEVLLGTPPPPPPPGVPDLEKTEEAKEGRLLTTRERMEMHRANAVCRSCHQYMDPIGLALDNFDVTGRWRTKENGAPLDTRGELYDGTPVSTPAELQAALLDRPIPLLRNFTLNLMAYALGRRVEYFDQPTVRAVTARAGEQDYRFSAFVVGIVESDAFRMKRLPVADEADASAETANRR
jgi:hypothetical protein